MNTKKYDPYPKALIEAVAQILGDTNDGLTNSEIERVLAAIPLKDPRVEAEAANPAVRTGLMYVSMSKRDRIAKAILNNQNSTGTGNALLAFVREAMKPARYTNYPARRQGYQSALNQVLVLEGLKVTDTGAVGRAPKADTLSEAARLAGTLTTELRRREAHTLALHYCTEEIVAQDPFHAVHEAVKGICDRLRTMSGSTLDGHPLIEATLVRPRSGAVPPVRLNSLTTETERNEQNGLANIVKGLVSRYRNPTAHEARVVRDAERPYEDRELLEVLTAVSLIHHALDGADVYQ